MSGYADARAEWLRQHEHDWFCLAQLLVTTLDHDAKNAPRTIRGLQLSRHEREVLRSFLEHMQARLPRSGEAA